MKPYSKMLLHYVTSLLSAGLFLVLSSTDLSHPIMAYPYNDQFNNSEDFEEKNSVKLCCAWGSHLVDGILTYNINDDTSSEEQQQSVRKAVEEWDAKIEPLELDEVLGENESDITFEFRIDNKEGNGLAGNTAKIYNERGFIEKVEISLFKGKIFGINRKEYSITPRVNSNC